MKLEVIAATIEDIHAANEHGADRIELCMGMDEGGLTPSYGFIKKAVEASRIPVYVMIRPHSQSFHYSDEDIDLMIEDIKVCRQLGAGGIVLGALTEEGDVDEKAISRLVGEAEGLDITFHRAIDSSRDPVGVVKSVAKFKQITRILTAGGQIGAPKSIPELKTLMEAAENTHITIMPGTGIDPENVQPLLDELKPQEIHVGTGVRFGRTFMSPIDPEKVQEMKKVIGQ